MRVNPSMPGWCAALSLALAGVACGTAADAPRARNLLFVSIDTLRADHLSCYGYGRETSPRLDELAARSQRFENLWSVLPTTLPAHAAMFTSLYPTLVGAKANGYVVSKQAHTLAERLGERGFETGAFVSAAPLHPRFGLRQGFATYDFPPNEERPGDRTRARAVEWLRERQGERFFCFVHLFDPHTWYTAPAEERALFGAPAGVQPSERGFLAETASYDAARRAELIDAYDAEIRFADGQVGLLLDELESLGLAGSTLVVVTSDHGESLAELIDDYAYGYDHGEFLHMRELHVPLILHVPPGAGALSQAREHEQVLSSLDLMPTLLELLGVPRDGFILGRSLVPLLEGGSLTARPVFAERRALTRGEIQSPPSAVLVGSEYSVASEGWLFVASEGRPEELYDLRADPAATRNVAAQQPAERARMAQLLEGWQAAQAAAGSLEAAPEGEDIDPALLEALRALGYAAD